MMFRLLTVTATVSRGYTQGAYHVEVIAIDPATTQSG